MKVASDERMPLTRKRRNVLVRLFSYKSVYQGLSAKARGRPDTGLFSCSDSNKLINYFASYDSLAHFVPSCCITSTCPNHTWGIDSCHVGTNEIKIGEDESKDAGLPMIEGERIWLSKHGGVVTILQQATTQERDVVSLQNAWILTL